MKSSGVCIDGVRRSPDLLFANVKLVSGESNFEEKLVEISALK